MLYKSAAILALGASAVVASPYKRQVSSVISAASSAASSAVGSAVTGASSTAAASSAVSSAGATSASASAAATGSAASTSAAITGDASTAATSASSALESVISSAAGETGASSAPLPTATTQANATDAASFAFGCPDGYSITYAVGVAPYPSVDIEQAYSALEMWGTAIPPPIESVSSEGMGEGATRSWSLSAAGTNISVSEVLTRVNATPSSFLEQEWNLTAPLTVSPSLIISNYTNVLTLYSNSTDNATTVQLFSNFCTSNQTAGLVALSQLVTVYLTGLGSLFANETMMTNTTSAANMTSSGVAASASSLASSASSAITSGTSQGVAGTITSGASSVAGVITSGAAGAASTALSAITSAPGSIATSLVGAVTSIL